VEAEETENKEETLINEDKTDDEPAKHEHEHLKASTTPAKTHKKKEKATTEKKEKATFTAEKQPESTSKVKASAAKDKSTEKKHKQQHKEVQEEKEVKEVVKKLVEKKGKKGGVKAPQKKEELMSTRKSRKVNQDEFEKYNSLLNNKRQRSAKK